MKKLVTILMLVLSLGGCAADGLDPSTPELEPGAVAAAKADGAFGATTLRLGDRAMGETSGDGLVLYAIALDEGDQIRLTVRRTSGDLRPSAYLYRGTEVFLRPASFDVTADSVTLDYTLEQGGEHHILVKAYRGEGAGGFVLETACTGGACDGVPVDPIARQSLCIQDAADCALAELPSWDGRVADARARSIFEGCLASQGEPCADACTDDAGACDTIIGQLPFFADQSEACLGVMTSCLSGCEEIGGYYSSDEIENTAANACWSGYNGNCLELVQGHVDCGGADYAAGTVEACRATCAATEGAWDEGPWDGCMEECDSAARADDDFIGQVADEAGELVSIDSSDAFDPVSFRDLPEAIRAAAEREREQWNAEAERFGRTDMAFLDETDEDGGPFSITRDGRIIGYMVPMTYAIDESGFDGGGASLYFNLSGALITSVEWWG
ncbi:MAG: hypothetical protein VYE22_00315 [Myxococcota bacterium]|nr:hypothetical protein [Myxococcota bacterium]